MDANTQEQTLQKDNGIEALCDYPNDDTDGISGSVWRLAGILQGNPDRSKYCYSPSELSPSAPDNESSNAHRGKTTITALNCGRTIDEHPGPAGREIFAMPMRIEWREGRFVRDGRI